MPVGAHQGAGRLAKGVFLTNLEPIDVVMCTWNSNSAHFRKCLLSIRREVEVHHFIAVDRNSSDGTLETVQRVFPEAKFIQTVANLGQAQRMGLENVDTPYFAFIDDDIELCEGWFGRIMDIVKNTERVGAVQGFTRYDPSYMDKARAYELRRKKAPVQEITSSGLTHDVVVLTEALKDFNPGRVTHSREEVPMTQHIIMKGYKWLENSQAQAIHYRGAGKGVLSDLGRNFLKEQWNGASDRLVRPDSSSCSRSIPRLLVGFLNGDLKYLAISILVSDPRISLLYFSGRFGYLNGFLSPDKHATPFKLHVARR